MYVYVRERSMARKTKEDAEQTKQAILNSALQTFYEKGFSRTTFDDIAKRINLTKGAVYWHFKNKADVIAEIIKQRITNQEQSFEKVQTILELKEKIMARTLAVEKDKNVRDFLFFMIYRMEWSETVLDNVWGQIGKLCEIQDNNLYEELKYLQQIGQIKKDTDITVLRDILICFLRGCINRYISGTKNNINLCAVVSEGFDAIMNGVKVEKN